MQDVYEGNLQENESNIWHSASGTWEKTLAEAGVVIRKEDR